MGLPVRRADGVARMTSAPPRLSVSLSLQRWPEPSYKKKLRQGSCSRQSDPHLPSCENVRKYCQWGTAYRIVWPTFGGGGNEKMRVRGRQGPGVPG